MGIRIWVRQDMTLRHSCGMHRCPSSLLLRGTLLEGKGGARGKAEAQCGRTQSSLTPGVASMRFRMFPLRRLPQVTSVSGMLDVLRRLCNIRPDYA